MSAAWWIRGVRRWLVRARLTRPRGLQPGRRVSARLILPVAAAMRLPSTALIEHQGRHFVFVYRGGAFEARPVEPVRVTKGAVYLEKGLDESATVAVTAAAALKAAWLGIGAEEGE